MGKALKFTGLVVGVLLALVVIREAFFSYTNYFIIVTGAKLYVDGRPASGWLHKGGKGRSFILTRTTASNRESYRIVTVGQKGSSVSSCGDWTAPRFPMIAIGDVNPPCFSFDLREDPNPPLKLPERRPAFGPRFVEFTADDGSRILASR
jgi:hypothetical protein